MNIEKLSWLSLGKVKVGKVILVLVGLATTGSILGVLAGGVNLEEVESGAKLLSILFGYIIFCIFLSLMVKRISWWLVPKSFDIFNMGLIYGFNLLCFRLIFMVILGDFSLLMIMMDSVVLMAFFMQIICTFESLNIDVDFSWLRFGNGRATPSGSHTSPNTTGRIGPGQNGPSNNGPGQNGPSNNGPGPNGPPNNGPSGTGGNGQSNTLPPTPEERFSADVRRINTNGLELYLGRHDLGEQSSTQDIINREIRLINYMDSYNRALNYRQNAFRNSPNIAELNPYGLFATGNLNDLEAILQRRNV